MFPVPYVPYTFSSPIAKIVIYTFHCDEYDEITKAGVCIYIKI